jgi:methionine-gamma-lyase
MYHFSANHSISTLVTHVGEDDNPHHTHVTPIYQTSTFNFPDVATGAGIVARTEPGYYYTRLGNPNLDHLARKIAILEGLGVHLRHGSHYGGIILAAQIW